MKEITVQISDAMYEFLRDAAHARGTTVTTIATAAVCDAARQWERPVAKLVADRHAMRESVGQIAGALGLTNKRVQETLRALHLPPNPPPRVEKPINPRARKARP